MAVGCGVRVVAVIHYTVITTWSFHLQLTYLDLYSLPRPELKYPVLGLDIVLHVHFMLK